MTVMRRLWNEFTAEATFTPYPGSAFEPSLVTKHIALVAEKGDSIVGTVYANTTSLHFGYVFGLYTRPDSRRQNHPGPAARRTPPRPLVRVQARPSAAPSQRWQYARRGHPRASALR